MSVAIYTKQLNMRCDSVYMMATVIVYIVCFYDVDCTYFIQNILLYPLTDV